MCRKTSKYPYFGTDEYNLSKISQYSWQIGSKCDQNYKILTILQKYVLGFDRNLI